MIQLLKLTVRGLRALRRGGPVGLGHWWRMLRLRQRHAYVMECLRRENAMHKEQMALLHQERLYLLDEQQRVNVEAAQFWRAVR